MCLVRFLGLLEEVLTIGMCDFIALVRMLQKSSYFDWNEF